MSSQTYEKYVEYLKNTNVHDIVNDITITTSRIKDVADTIYNIAKAVEDKQSIFDAKLVEEHLDRVTKAIRSIGSFVNEFDRCIPPEDDPEDDVGKCILDVLTDFVEFLRNITLLIDSDIELFKYMDRGFNAPPDLDHLIEAVRICVKRLLDIFVDELRGELDKFGKIALAPLADILIVNVAKK